MSIAGAYNTGAKSFKLPNFVVPRGEGGSLHFFWSNSGPANKYEDKRKYFHSVFGAQRSDSQKQTKPKFTTH